MERCCPGQLMTAAAHASTTHVHPTTSIISLTAPSSRTQQHSRQVVIPGEVNAAVLVPLCNCGKLRSHAGEVSFPGGRVDQDASFLDTALRETQEEGFVYPPGAHGTDTWSLDDPLPSISLSSLTVSQPEVATVFHLPFSAFVSPARIRFEGVSDPLGRPEVGGGKEGRLEVWGLTGWYMSLLMRILRVYT
ncbi:uncharacterized protein EDB91DRAFT_1238857 [Suillus paluster]|uniref:uncharacterized protein n=1 Tax=Suillus paluster TaxID=48578 RepID=UPI001B86628C|nr:uncharacterized protein EDB91DRAFT_1238857 [Suillus paluster]KAG1732020.1 hypothetical protein EDB91DRAFT_1238857 [Suillus paluster]